MLKKHPGNKKVQAQLKASLQTGVGEISVEEAKRLLYSWIINSIYVAQ